jgi:hypothetical protein
MNHLSTLWQVIDRTSRANAITFSLNAACGALASWTGSDATFALCRFAHLLAPHPTARPVRCGAAYQHTPTLLHPISNALIGRPPLQFAGFAELAGRSRGDRPTRHDYCNARATARPARACSTARIGGSVRVDPSWLRSCRHWVAATSRHPIPGGTPATPDFPSRSDPPTS